MLEIMQSSKRSTLIKDSWHVKKPPQFSCLVFFYFFSCVCFHKYWVCHCCQSLQSVVVTTLLLQMGISLLWIGNWTITGRTECNLSIALQQQVSIINQEHFSRIGEIQTQPTKFSNTHAGTSSRMSSVAAVGDTNLQRFPGNAMKMSNNKVSDWEEKSGGGGLMQNVPGCFSVPSCKKWN